METKSALAEVPNAGGLVNRLLRRGLVLERLRGVRAATKALIRFDLDPKVKLRLC